MKLRAWNDVGTLKFIIWGQNINANKWYTHAYAQFIHTLDGKMMFCMWWTRRCNEAYENLLVYIIAKQQCNVKEHTSIIIIEFVWNSVRNNCLGRCLVQFLKFIEINRSSIYECLLPHFHRPPSTVRHFTDCNNFETQVFIMHATISIWTGENVKQWAHSSLIISLSTHWSPGISKYDGLTIHQHSDDTFENDDEIFHMLSNVLIA